MYGLEREMAKLRLDDRLREAQRDRLAAQVVRRPDRRRSPMRWISEAVGNLRPGWMLRAAAQLPKARELT